MKTSTSAGSRPLGYEAAPTRVLAVTNMYPSRRFPGSGTFVAEQVRSLRELDLAVEVVHAERLEHGRGTYRRLRRSLADRLREFDPEIVHVMYGGVMADVVTRSVDDRPVVVSLCGTDILGGGGSGLGRVTRRLGVFASRRAVRRAAGVVVKSENLLAALPSEVPPGRVWLVPNGIDLARFSPRDRAGARAELGWQSTSRHVLFPAGRRRPEKRFELAQAAVARVRAAGFRVDLHTLENVRHGDVPTWLNAADVVLLTSTHEGSPNAVKEALACEVPVVSVDVGDVRARLAAAEGCYIAETDVEDLADKLARVFASPERPRTRAAVRDLSLERVALRLRDVYAAVCTAHPHRSTKLDHSFDAAPRERPDAVDRLD